MDSKIIIIQASARSNGNTSKLVSYISTKLNANVLDVKQHQFEPYNYDGNYTDDFIAIMEGVVHSYDIIIFATPVYWYAMSGLLKNFFDRLTDFISIRKDLGRKLKDKKVFVVTTSSGDHLSEDFWLPFQKTAQYLQMNFVKGHHFENSTSLNNQVTNFIANNFNLE